MLDSSGKPLPQTVDPRKMAHDAARNRRARQIRNDAQAMWLAARVAERHGWPAVSNACSKLAATLQRECGSDSKPVEAIEVKDIL
jgi:hypothetical protein